MRILVGYATTEGQTRKIARFVADHLAGAGHAVELLPLSDAEGLELGRFDRAVLAGSVHGGQYQETLRAFASDAAAGLAAMPTLFLSVSLSAAGEDAEDWAGLRDCVARFVEQTGWTPGRVEHVAGAFRFTEYDFFRAWAMRWIAREKGEKIDTSADTEYTDWAALAAVLDDWAGAS
jgi:menaquinone-dependent protoporphyrinogen oxidase